MVTLQKRVKVSIQQRALAGRPSGWLSRWADTLSDGGCLPGGERHSFVTRILESFPLKLRDAYGIAFGQPTNSRFIDFYPGQKLKIVGPVLQDESQTLETAVESTTADGAGGLRLEVRSSANLIGYEESRYSIAVRGDGDLSLTHDYTNLFRDAEMETLEGPSVTAVAFIPKRRYIRMIYLTRVAETGDHDVLLVVAATREELETRSEAIVRDPGKCKDSGSAEWCHQVPNNLSLNLYVTVALNGIEVDVAPGLPLGQFLRNGMSRRAGNVPPGLEVHRPFGDRLERVEFDQSSAAILSLPLMGGEVILVQSRYGE